MKTIKINVSSGSYEIKLGYGILKNLPDLLEQINISGKVIIITDTNVSSLYLDMLKEILKDKYDLDEVIIPAGEEYKTLDTVYGIYEKLSEINVTRKDTILAFGGGVTGDISGFCAATYLRGISYV